MTEGICMNQQLSITNGDHHIEQTAKLSFYMDTMKMDSLSPRAFYEAGATKFQGKRFFWQNREKTFTLVGLGHAYTVTSDDHKNRYAFVEDAWQNLMQYADLDAHEQQPIFFGSYTFDPAKTPAEEWQAFPETYFALATHQLVIRNEQIFISTFYVSEEPITEEKKQSLRNERDELLHSAQVNGLASHIKPQITQTIERHKEEYLQSIENVTALIKQQQADKVVIARSLALAFDGDITSEMMLAQITAEQPESYLFIFENGQDFFFGASPERLVMVKDHDAYSSCVAGSIKRGSTKEQDDAYGSELLNDAKNLQEHQYVVDMIRQSFDENCANYTLPEGPQLLKIRDIQHLFTPVEGQLKDDASILRMVKNLHPTPALGGAPRGRAMEVIRQYEPTDRGLYAAPIGWMNAAGDGEFAVAIRSALVHDNQAYLYAGGGIVADSNPQSEYEETLVKFRPMLRAFGGTLHG